MFLRGFSRGRGDCGDGIGLEIRSEGQSEFWVCWAPYRIKKGDISVTRASRVKTKLVVAKNQV
jgi:hypothetical protein